MHSCKQGPHRYPGDPHLCPISEGRKRPPGVALGIWRSPWWVLSQNPWVCGRVIWQWQNPRGPIGHLAASEACRAVSQSTRHLFLPSFLPRLNSNTKMIRSHHGSDLSIFIMQLFESNPPVALLDSRQFFQCMLLFNFHIFQVRIRKGTGSGPVDR